MSKLDSDFQQFSNVIFDPLYFWLPAGLNSVSPHIWFNLEPPRRGGSKLSGFGVILSRPLYNE
jgi:hypothetical protein